MRYNKTLKWYVSILCVIAVLVSVVSVNAEAATTYNVTASANKYVQQGEYSYCYVYIDSTENLAALDVSVHYDPAKIRIHDLYNSVECLIYDSITNTDNIQFSYIFDGVGDASETQLFMFCYEVLSNAEPGTTSFDITIGEAYDSSLNDVAVSGSRCSLKIMEAVTNKYCYVYGTSDLSTSVLEEFTVDYQFDTYEIASGSAVVNYDSELFEVVSVVPGGILDNKITDINTDIPGTVYVSFVGTEYSDYLYDFLTVTFRTVKNTDEVSEITLKTTELYDLSLNPITCQGYTTTASVAFDNSYVGDAPKMFVNATYDTVTENVYAEIVLEEGSNLGAGDFILGFDPEILTLSSYKKGFTPTFFNINDKEAEKGILKFSIISLEDIKTTETVLKLVFDVNEVGEKLVTDLNISGTMLSDSLTKPIVLNFVDEAIVFCFNSHDEVHHDAKDPTCTEIGWDAHVTCTRCDYTTYVELPANGHTEGTPVTENSVSATCTADGSYDTVVYCTVCDTELSRVTTTVPATGHSFGKWTETLAPTCTAVGSERRDCDNCEQYETREVTTLGHDEIAHEAKAPTCTVIGWDAYVTCSRCDYTTYVEIPAIGHKYDSVVTAPTCTEQGYTTYTCHCGDSYISDYVDATGHSFGKWTETLAPTCTAVGSVRRDCVSCDHYETKVVGALGHTSGEAAIENSVSATCTTDGSYDIVVYCTVCDAELSREITTVPATGHLSTVKAIENSVSATCTVNGSYDTVEYCTVCNTVINRLTTVVPALGHKSTVKAIENSVSATCTVNGSYDTVEYCTVCNTEINRLTTVIPATGHKSTVKVIENSVSATCAVDGSYDTVVYCTVCHAELSREITTVPATGHLSTVKVIENTVYETCITDGRHDTVVYCTVCHAELSRETTTVPATGHLSTVEVIENSVNETCITDGSYDTVVYCTVCNSETSRVTTIVRATGHIYGEWYELIIPTCTKIGFDKRDCVNCDQYESKMVDARGHAEVAHEAKAPTCTKIGWETYETCSRCDYTTYVEIAATGHKYSSVVTAPTCTDKGYTTYTCHCGDSYISDYVDETGHTEAIDNAVDPTCVDTGLTEGKHCTACDTILVAQQITDTLGHDFFSSEWTVDVEPTATTLGQKSRHCSRCDEITDVIEIAKLVEIIDTSKKFTDVTDSWSKSGIDYVVSYGYMNGTGNGSTFSPSGTMTRAMIVSVLHRIAGKPAPTAKNPFTDLEADQTWYHEAVIWAYENAIVTGISKTSFAPTGPVTREQMATFLYRFAKYMGYDTSKTNDISTFPDASKVGSWAYDALAWANAEGLITGAKGSDGVTRLDPQGNATREQVATILMRYCQAFEE